MPGGGSRNAAEGVPYTGAEGVPCQRRLPAACDAGYIATSRLVPLPLPTMTTCAPDPIFKSARREAAVVLGLWLTACHYSITYCHLFGYERKAAEITYVFGFPDWVFWGIVLPWVLCAGLSLFISVGFMTDGDLAEGAADAEDTHA